MGLGNMVGQRCLHDNSRGCYATDDSELTEGFELEHGLIGTRLSSEA